MGAILVLLSAILVKMVLVAIVTKINAEPIDSMLFANMVFLMFQRPLFVIAAALGFSPILLRNPFTYPITAFLEHSFWYPLARLSYGAYLSAGIFMLFRTLNMERGMWACELDAFFLFMAYLSFAYLFSFIITILVEMPCHSLFQTFILGTEIQYNRAGATTTSKAAASKASSSGGKRNSRRLSEESESDAETLDTVVDEAEQSMASSFLSNAA